MKNSANEALRLENKKNVQDVKLWHQKRLVFHLVDKKLTHSFKWGKTRKPGRSPRFWGRAASVRAVTSLSEPTSCRLLGASPPSRSGSDPPRSSRNPASPGGSSATLEERGTLSIWCFVYRTLRAARQPNLWWCRSTSREGTRDGRGGACEEEWCGSPAGTPPNEGGRSTCVTTCESDWWGSQRWPVRTSSSTTGRYDKSPLWSKENNSFVCLLSSLNGLGIFYHGQNTSCVHQTLTGGEGEDVEGHVCQRDNGQHAVVSVGLDEVVTCDGCGVDVVLSERTYKSLWERQNRIKLAKRSHF